MNRKQQVENIIKTAYKNQEGHIASALSILDAVNVVFAQMTGNDEFILSKGHASLALYIKLLELGKITEEEFFSFGQFNSKLGGHPSSHKLSKSVKISTGSLGHGLPFAVGLALAKKIRKQSGTIYCVIGDGEANEGTIWESALVALTYQLNNLVVLMDFNRSGERAIKLNSAFDKFKAFGWSSFTVDGHSQEAIQSILSVEPQFPKFLEMITVKGKGCKEIENKPEWHHRQPKNDTEYQKLISSIY